MIDQVNACGIVTVKQLAALLIISIISICMKLGIIG